MIPAIIFSLLLSIATQSYPLPKVEAATLTKDELIAMAMANATAYHLNAAHFVATIECESHFNVDAVGDHGQSYGIVQIYLLAHKDITGVEALDPFFALDWMAKQWSLHKEYMWTCYRDLAKNNWQ